MSRCFAQYVQEIGRQVLRPVSHDSRRQVRPHCRAGKARLGTLTRPAACAQPCSRRGLPAAMSGKSHIGRSGDRFEPYRWSAIRAGLVSTENKSFWTSGSAGTRCTAPVPRIVKSTLETSPRLLLLPLLHCSINPFWFQGFCFSLSQAPEAPGRPGYTLCYAIVLPDPPGPGQKT